MSEKKHETLSESFNVALNQPPYRELPWRSPEERPENMSIVICRGSKDAHFPVLHALCVHDVDGDWWARTDKYVFHPLELSAWMYSDELPLPDWVQR